MTTMNYGDLKRFVTSRGHAPKYEGERAENGLYTMEQPIETPRANVAKRGMKGGRGQDEPIRAQATQRGDTAPTRTQAGTRIRHGSGNA